MAQQVQTAEIKTLGCGVEGVWQRQAGVNCMIFFSLRLNDSPITETEELDGFMEGGEEVTDGGCDRH